MSIEQAMNVHGNKRTHTYTIHIQTCQIDIFILSYCFYYSVVFHILWHGRDNVCGHNCALAMRIYVCAISWRACIIFFIHFLHHFHCCRCKCCHIFEQNENGRKNEHTERNESCWCVFFSPSVHSFRSVLCL